MNTARGDTAELDLRILEGHARSADAVVFARISEAWHRDVAHRVAAVGAATATERAARLHELRSLSFAVGARGLVRLAATLEQRSERGEALTAVDLARLEDAARLHRVALARWWSERRPDLAYASP